MGWNHRLEKEQTKGAQHFSILPLAALKLDLVSIVIKTVQIML